MPVAAYQPIGAESLAASYVNLANPGVYDAAPGVAPTLGAGGWNASGAEYLTTGITPSSGWSAIALFSNAQASSSICGNAGVPRFYLWPSNGGITRVYGYGNAANSVAGAQTSGVMAMAASKCYLNGNFDGTAGTWSGTSGVFYLLASEPAEKFIGTVAAVAIYSSTLDAAQVEAVSAAMAAL